jgi:hypothetical protein
VFPERWVSINLFPRDPEPPKSRIRLFNIVLVVALSVKVLNVMESIPKTCFTFWQGTQFSKLHYYTIYSLVKYNPGVEIVVYTSSSSRDILIDWKTDEHTVPITNTLPFSSLSDFGTRIKIVHVDFQEEYNISNDISVVFKADFIRIAKLYEHGGIWFDFDILFIQPIPEFIFDVSSTELFFFCYSNTIPTGFIACRPKIPITEILFAHAKRLITVPGDYQKIGPFLWTILFAENSHLFTNSTCLDTSMIYPYLPETIHEILKNGGGLNKITEHTFGVHWFNGDPAIKKFINKPRNSVLYPTNCILNRCICKTQIDPFL